LRVREKRAFFVVRARAATALAAKFARPFFVSIMLAEKRGDREDTFMKKSEEEERRMPDFPEGVTFEAEVTRRKTA
tara:strand:+ start:264 stop:491 length:228 start_codon:yes stop_codon:yes gene_type:complete